MTGTGDKTVYLYDLRDAAGNWLGRVVITEDGYFSTVSDYGGYTYWWDGAGKCFRRFLMNMDDVWYLLSKIAPRREYHGAATLAAVKAHILEARRSGTMTADEARIEWNILEEHSRLDTREDFAVWYTRTELPDAHEFYRGRTDPQAAAFAEKVWPALVAAIRAELAEEAAR